MNLNTIEWSGSVIGLLGAGLVASNTTVSGFGFIAFLASNYFWIAYALRVKSRPLLLMQVGFTLTSVLGIVRWLA